MRVFIVVVGILFLVSCAEAPKCHSTVESSNEANAGCLVVSENKLLLIEDHRGGLSLPGGSSNTGETAQCTAEREVWEETGVEVKAVKRFTTFENGFELFECDIVGKQVLDGSARPWRFEVDEMYWLGFTEFENRSWRYPEQVVLMKAYLESHRADK